MIVIIIFILNNKESILLYNDFIFLFLFQFINFVLVVVNNVLGDKILNRLFDIKYKVNVK